MKEIALIDGDIVTYRCSSSCNPTKIKPFKENLDVALDRVETLMNRILYETNAKTHKVFIGGQDNFRYTIYPEYKANRKNILKPEYLEACREYLVTEWQASIINGYEADDELGIEQTIHGTESIICSIDKDLLQIPGWHYNFIKGIEKFVSPYDGLRSFYKQIVTGDASDNIPAFDNAFRSSIPNFVLKFLEPLEEITEETEMYLYVLDIYLNNSSENEVDIRNRMHRNAKLLYILKKENEFWNPPIDVNKSVD